MAVFNILFWIGVAMLAAVAIVWAVGFRRTVATANCLIEVACAGSHERNYPFAEVVRRNSIQQIQRWIDMQPSPGRYMAFVLKGLSMQFANLKTDDIVVVRKYDGNVSALRFPALMVFAIRNARPGACAFKIRRAWKLVDWRSSAADFHRELQGVLASADFAKLRSIAGAACPTDDCLIAVAKNKYSKFKKENPTSDFILSTTYRRDNNRIEFSLHPLSSLKGMVAAKSTKTPARERCYATSDK